MPNYIVNPKEGCLSQKRWNRGTKQMKWTNKMVDLNPTMSVITLHGLNILIIRQRLSDWKLKIKKKQNPATCVYKSYTLNIKTQIVWK